MNGAMYDPDGINTASVPSHDEGPDAVITYADTVISNDELLTLNVDVFVPAALGSVITEENAEAIARSRRRERKQPDVHGCFDSRRPGYRCDSRYSRQHRRSHGELLQVTPEH